MTGAPDTGSLHPSMLVWARNLAVAFVALQHLGFLVLEMFLWKSPTGRRIFRTTPEFAAQSAPLAANQGLYNGFLAAGLFWSLLAPEPMAEWLRLFFLVCVAVAAVFGAATVGRRILWVQGFPAAVAMVLDRLVRG